MPGRNEFIRVRVGEDFPMTQEPHHILPLVLRMRGQIDKVFVRYVGPIAGELSRDEFEQWRVEGHVGPLALHRYIARLARYIVEDATRNAFVVDASKCIHLPDGAKAP